MTKILATSGGETTEHEIEPGPGGFTVILHQQGIRVDVPEFVEVGPRDTVDCVGVMTQKQWTWISTGPVFKKAWELAFQDQNIPIPENIIELNKGDLGLAHVAGMIILVFEAAIAGQNVFIRNPETYLHPKTERTIIQAIRELIKFAGATGDVVAVAEAPKKTKKRKKKNEASTPETNYQQDKELTLKWLHCMEDPGKQFAKVGEQIYTVGDMILEVTQDSPIGKQMVAKFAELREGK